MTKLVNGVNAPTSLDGVSVTVNGRPAFIYFISPNQININTPEDTATGPVTMTAGSTLSFGATAPVSFNLAGSTLSTGPFAVTQASHNGAAPARLTNLELDGSGSVWATYGTGERVALGQIGRAHV